MVPKKHFFDIIRSTYSSGESVTLSFQEISDTISRQKKGKAAAPDGIATELICSVILDCQFT